MKTLGIRHYSQIAKRAAERAKDRRPQYAIVKRIDGVRADLQIGQSLNIVKNVEVIGDTSQLAKGDTVQISWWSQDRPVALAGLSLGDTTQRLDQMADKLASIVTTRPTSTPNPTGGISDWQILRFSGGALASVHDPTAAGLEDAMTVSSSGDMVMLPAMELEANFTIPTGVTVTGMSRSTTLIRGTATLLDRATLEKVRMLDTETADGEAIGAISSGAANIRDCDIWACNCGTGPAKGAKVNSGTLTITNSSISGEAGAQPGYGVYIASGRAKLYETTVYGSTAQYNDDNNVYVHGTLLGEASCECATTTGAEGIAGSFYIDGGYTAQTVQPHEVGVTLGDTVTTLTRKTSYTPVWQVGGNWERGLITGIGATANYVYLTENHTGKLIRLPTTTGEPTILTLEGVTSQYDGHDHNVFVKNDNEVYAVYADGANFNYRIEKYNIPAGTHTSVLNVAGEEAPFDGTLWTLNWINHLTRIKTEAFDKLVISTNWGNDEVGHPDTDVIRVTILNLANDQVEHDQFYYPGPKAWEPSLFQNITTTAVVYQDKVIFMVYVDDWKQDLAGVSVCWFPTFIVDCTNNSVTIVDDLKRSITNDYWPWCYDNAGVDRTSGQFYFFAGDYDGSQIYNALIKVDLTTPPYNTVVEAQYAYSTLIIQGKTKCYGLEWNDTDRYRVRAIPSMTQLGIMDAGEGQCVVDEEAGYIWELTETELHGVSIPGGSERRIPLDFLGEKYDMPYSRYLAALMIFDNKALVQIHSRNEVDDPDDPDPDFTVSIYQNEFVVMGAP